MLLTIWLACAGGETDGEVADLLGILVSPDRPVVPVGGSVQLVATGLLADRDSRDLTPVADWHSDDPSVATVDQSLDREGRLSGLSAGETTIWAQAGEVVSPTVHVVVTEAQLEGISVSPESLALAVGDEVQLQAQSAWSDGTRGDATGQVQWITADGEVAQIALGGSLLAAGEGRTTVHAEWEGKSSPKIGVDVTRATDGRPNLEVSRLSAEGAGGVITLSASVHNAGGASALGFFVDVFVDPGGAPTPGDLGDDFVYVSYVGPGDTVDIPFTLYADEGPHEVWVLVDSEGSVEESDEDDNAFSAAVDVGSEAQAGPNLVVYGFDFLADTDSIYYVVDVFNAGTEDAGPFYVDIYVDRATAPGFPSDGDTFTFVEGLPAGELINADFLVERACSVCNSWVLLDSYDEVPEVDEDDNVGGPVRVGEEDTGWWDTGF